MALVDSEKIRQLMKSRGHNVSSLAEKTGLCRQTVHNILNPDYVPITSGFRSVATVLGVDPLDLLKKADEDSGVLNEIHLALDAAVEGEPRAFEILPALLCRMKKKQASEIGHFDPDRHQLLAAAGSVLSTFRNTRWLRSFIKRHTEKYEQGRAIFFSNDMMSPERIVFATPESMRRHLVFGAFEMHSFERHLKTC